MKHITEIFSIKFGYREKDSFHITARNYNDHQAGFSGAENVCLSTEDMRNIAKHLTETADRIEKDPVFNKG